MQLNVSNFKKSFGFYKEFLEVFNYKVIIEQDFYAGFSNGTVDIWLIQTEKDYLIKSFHRKATGLNHLAFKVSSKKEVDDFHNDFLKKWKIPTLYDTPKKFPEYNDEYYAVFFEDPDRVKLEVVYFG
jgi:catechol 2,3-dioxygenase-like lactoylglutathione lyase family enzyme